MNKRNKMMDTLRALHSLQMICLYADDVSMQIDTAIYSDTKVQSIFVTVKKNDADYHSTGPHKFFDFYNSDSEGVVIEKITQVRNFINEITK